MIDYGGRKQTVTALDKDFIGSAIALFAAPSSEAIDVIGKIEVGEGLPHPMINGEWIKSGRIRILLICCMRETRWIMRWIMPILAISTWFISGIYFKVGDILICILLVFPEGAKQIKAFTEKAKARGIDIGVHTLTMFTSTHDPYVSPVPSDSLAISGSSVLVKEISATDKDIEIDSPEFSLIWVKLVQRKLEQR